MRRSSMQNSVQSSRATSRSKRAAAAAAVAVMVCGAGLLGAGSAQAVTSGNYCGSTAQLAGDVYAQACVNISGGNAYSYLHVSNHGNHSISGTTWTNSRGNYMGYGNCNGLTDYNGSWCFGSSVSLGYGNYAQGQGYLIIDGVQYGTLYSPSEYLG
ncbi:hypothetical protein ACFXDJ_33140 [Streptomyces sp. NPDC059443]|uniref:hypothetical protein n=1 Tax=unclassified Streptomyces TaxID=2593676 RepID=UPI0036B1A8B2